MSLALAASSWGAVEGNGGVGVSCAAQSIHRVALVIQHGDGQMVRRCVAFAEAQLSGEEVLRRSGVPIATQEYGGDLGVAVCQIDGEPAVYADCLGDGAPPVYWTLWTGGSQWTLASTGVSRLMLADGDQLGFRYEAGSDPPATAAGTCPPVVTTPVPVASSRAGPTPTAVVRAAATRSVPAPPPPSPSSAIVVNPETAQPATPSMSGAPLTIAPTSSPAGTDAPLRSWPGLVAAAALGALAAALVVAIRARA